MHFSLTKCSVTDTSEIIELLSALYFELGEEADCVHFLTPDLVQKVIKSNTTEAYLIKEENGRNIGIITLTACNSFYAGGEYGLLDEMYLKPAYRSLNIGSQIIEKIRIIAKERGWTRLDVTGPIDEKWSRTIAFYKKCGFEFTGPKLKLSI